jgi:S1-C subfamily serine protease
MKHKQVAALLLIVALSIAGCREFSIFETPTPVAPTSLGKITPTAIALPTPLPDQLVISADAVEALLENVYERTNPGVVNIDVAGATGNVITEFGSGSGFVIDTEGHIVTNNHVIEGADEIDVTFADGSYAVAKLVGADSYGDLAVVKVDVEASKLHPLTLGDSDVVKVGQRVIAIGNPFGLLGTMTVGIVSGKGRTLPSDSPDGTSNFSNPDIIQTDAAINPGNSGGPLLNSNGEVVGVNAAIRTTGTNRANSGVGFAIPSNTVKRVVDQILKTGRVSYPYLGVSIDYNDQFTMAEVAAALDLPVDRGVLVSQVVQGGPADKAGLQGGDREVTVRGIPLRAGGDIITAIDGDPITSFDQMIAYLASQKQVGQKVTLTILRGGETLELPLTLEERPR